MMTAIKLPAAGPVPAWQRAAPLVLALGALLWLFRDTAAAMVGIWSRSDTFAHGFLVPPIALWLAWRKRDQLAGVPVVPAPRWMAVLALCGFVWLLGELASAQALTQGALVAMAVCCVPAILGTRLARVVAFPLLFLFFCVPVGEFLIEPMMEGTADFTVAALRLSGIPVYREGLQFVIPSGNWSVVAACSGVRYLIASLMVGTLFAYLNFHSWRRRLAFVALSLLVPVVANWLRAYLIVMLGHVSSNQLAAGADHLVYGWVFFGVVILLMFMLGARFVDAAPAPVAPAGALVAAGAAKGAWASAAWVVMLLLGLHFLNGQMQLAKPGAASAIALPPTLGTQPAGARGHWQASDTPVTHWVPAYRHAAATASAHYRAAGSEPESSIGVWVGVYREQGYERKMISSDNRLVEEGSTAWYPLSQRRASAPVAGEPVSWRASLLRSPANLKVDATQRLLVWRVYRVAGRYVAGDAQAALWLALQRLAGRGDESAVWMVYALSGEDDRAAEARLARFVSEHLPTLVAATEGAASAR